ncbi:MAG: ribonuclease P protein component [Bdellovibrionaceae bacterium]|nr:ribonuclease P protein component [Pseudobdellovibrionaceae bacterium]
MKSLKSRKEFADLRKTGKKLRPSSWLLINYATHRESEIYLGITIPANVASAAIRNRLKRWSRDYFRGMKKSGLVANLIFLKQKTPEFFKQLRRHEFDEALETFFKKIQ